MSNDKKTIQDKDYKRGYAVGLGKGMLYGAMSVVGGFVLAAVVHRVIK